MRRRRNGEGTVIHRAKEHRWEVRLGGMSRYAKTEAEAVALLFTLRQQVASGPIVKKRHSVDETLKLWLEHIKTRVRPNTYASYALIVDTHLTPAIGRLRIEKLSALDVQRAVDAVSAGSRRHVKVVIKAALGWAMDMELTHKNVASKVSVPKKKRPDIHPFTEAELHQFVTVAASDPLEALWLLNVGAGPRMGEARGAQWSDIDLDHATFTVRRTLQPCGILEPKSDNSKRTIHLPKPVVSALRRWRKTTLEMRLKAGERWNEGDWVFTTDHGTPIDKRALDRKYKRFLRTAKVGKHRYHDQRHTFATRLLTVGVPAHEVASQMGDTVETLMSVYAHVMKSRERSCADAMTAILTTKG